jgi:hypothetical protein
LSRIAIERGGEAHAEGEVLELAAPPGQVDFESIPQTPSIGEEASS